MNPLIWTIYTNVLLVRNYWRLTCGSRPCVNCPWIFVMEKACNNRLALLPKYKRYWILCKSKQNTVFLFISFFSFFFPLFPLSYERSKAGILLYPRHHCCGHLKLQVTATYQFHCNWICSFNYSYKNVQLQLFGSCDYTLQLHCSCKKDTTATIAFGQKRS